MATLLSEGGGVSKASALRAVRQAPEIGDLGLIQPALSDLSDWVREQAYLVAAQLPTASSVQPLIHEIRLTYAGGQLLFRLPRYLALAHKIGSRAVVALALWGAALACIGLVVAATTGPAMVWLLNWATVKLTNHTTIVHPFFQIAQALSQQYLVASIILSFVITLVTLIYQREKQIQWIVRSNIIACTAIYLFSYLYISVNTITIGRLFYITLFCYLCWAWDILTIITVVISSTIIIGCSILFLLSERYFQLETRYILVDLYETLKRSENLMLFDHPYASIVVAFYIAISAYWIEGSYAGFSEYYMVGITAFLILAAFMSLLIVKKIDLRPKLKPKIESMLSTGEKITIYIVVGAFISIPSALIWTIRYFFGDTISRIIAWLDSVGVGHLIAYILIITGGIFSLAAMCFAGYVLTRWMRAELRWRLAEIRKRPLDPVRWVEDVRRAQTEDQAWLLRQASPTRFGLTLEETIDMIAMLGEVVVREPARSAFDAKLAELLAVRRQQRAD